MATQTDARGDAVDDYIERRRRVALVSDADPEAAAAFLRYHSGLEITPLSVDEAISGLDPAYAAVCLQHTRPEQADAVRRAQPDLPVLETGDDGAAVTVVAALINAVRRARATFAGIRVLVIDADAAPGIGALLTAVGARDLTFANAVPVDLPAPYDATVDLTAPDATLTFEPGAGPHRVHPLLALPGLLSVAVRRRSGIDVADRFAAAHALARLAAPGELLPDLRDPRITAAVHDAAAGPARSRRR